MKQIERIEPSIMHAAALETLKRIVSKHLDKVAADNRPALLKLANGKSSILDEALRVLQDPLALSDRQRIQHALHRFPMSPSGRRTA